MSAEASPPLGGTRALLQSLAPSLVPSERRVAQVCIDDPGFVAQASVADLAHRAAVSPATVVRACQRMGFHGFQRLKELIARDLAAAAASEGVASADPDHPVHQIFRRAGEGITGALGALDLEAFDSACNAVRAGGRLLIVGNGASLHPAQMVALHFLVSGRVCEAPVDVVAQHVAARLLRAGDVCIVVSDSGMNQFTLRAAQLAGEGGATVIAVTSYGKSELARTATYALVAGADFHVWNDGTVVGNIAQMLLLSALHQQVVGSDAAAKAARAEVLDEMRRTVVAKG